MGIMEILWYSRQLKRMSEGRDPKPNESPLWAFLASLVKSRLGHKPNQENADVTKT